MTIEALAVLVIEACENEGVEHMMTGAFATSLYGIPRSTKDVDVVISLSGPDPINRLSMRLADHVRFDAQTQFDTLTWGRRVVGSTRQVPPFKVELFELFDDPFVKEQFHRRRRMFSTQLKVTTWFPTAEDVVVQKLRWGRGKDLEDARDVIAVQGVETLDMGYVEKWCGIHGIMARLKNALSEIPPIN
jgi:hypothetical protein